MDAMQMFSEGERVFYRDHGPEDAGRVKKVVPQTTYSYIVEWDDKHEEDIYEQGQLRKADDKVAA